MKLKLSIAFASALISAAANAAITYDGFDYPVTDPATTLEASSADWAPLNTGTAPTVVAGSLSVTGLTSTGNKVLLPGGNFQEAIGTTASYNSGSVFFSFALNVTAAPTTATYSFALATGNTNYAAVVFFQAATGGYQIGLGNRSSGATPVYDTATTYAVGTTIYIVGSYTFNGLTGDDTSALWVNPDSSTFQGAAPTPTLTAAGGTDIATVTQFLVRGAAGSPAGEFDELRIGTSYAEVTGAVPETSSALLGAVGALVLLRRRR